MNILQISAPKSGSYWLHTILKQVLQKNGIQERSFIKEQEIYQKLKDRKFSFKDQAGVDMVDIEEEGIFSRISSVYREKIKDPSQFSRATSLVWTHSSLCSRSFEFFPLFDKRVCIVRDPRDRALSSAKFAFTPYMQKYYPTSYSSAEDFLDGEYEKLLYQWLWFTGNYLLHKQELDIHFIFYESLLKDFENEFKGLLNYLEINLDDADKKKIATAVDFSTMKSKSPKHLNKGKSNKWVGALETDQKKMARKIAGKLMEYLNYPVSEQENGLPRVPGGDLPPQLTKELQQMEWEGLFQKV